LISRRDRNVAAKFPGNGNHRAVLLSGPPGIGKTSAAGLVAKSLGYEVLEFNASDARSKQHIDVTSWYGVPFSG